MPPSDVNWKDWEKAIVQELDRLNEENKYVQRTLLPAMQNEINQIKIKLYGWCAVAAILGAILSLVFKSFVKV